MGHTAHEPACQRVCYRFHPLFGKSISVIRRYPITSPDGVIIALPDGSKCALPLWMLDPVFCASLTILPEPRIAIVALRALRELIDSSSLLSPSSSTSAGASPSPGGPDAPSTPNRSTTATVPRRTERPTTTSRRPRGLPKTPRTTARPGRQRHRQRKGKK